MNRIYYADGAIHQDNHKELNIGGNIGENALSRLIDVFFADIQDAEFVENEGKSPDPVNNDALTTTDDEGLFHFIHPEIGSDEEQDIHKQVKRLVARFGVQEICKYLNLMAEQNKILLPQSVEAAYAEMKRMGMPDGEGYAYKTFAKYYRK